MKKALILLFALAACTPPADVGPGQAAPAQAREPANRVPMFDKRLPRTFESVEKFSVETPMRCSVDWDNQALIKQEPFDRRDFSIERVDKGDPLPDIAVKDLSVKDQSADEIIKTLLKNTGIRVYYTDKFTKKLSLDSVSGSLEMVLDMISAMGDIYYSFDDRAQRLTLKRYAKWNLHVPLSKDVMLAMEDALRGADMDDIVVDWADKYLIFSGDFVAEEKIRNIVSRFSQEDYLIAYDMDIYRVEPAGGAEIEWSNILNAFNPGSVRLSQKGIIGRMLVVADTFNRTSVNEFLRPQGKVSLISTGRFIVPERWQGRFDIGRCSRDDHIEVDLALMTTSRYTPRAEQIGRLNSKIVLRTSKGDIAGYEAPARLGDNFLIIGIPTQYFAAEGRTEIAPNTELVALISPHIIKIARPGE